jgi:hypothetical protein
MLHSSDSEDDQPTAKVKQEGLVDRGICETVENDHQRTNVSKFDHEEFVEQKTSTNHAAEKRSSTGEMNGPPKKMKKLPSIDNSSIPEDQPKIVDGSLDNRLIEPPRTTDSESAFDYRHEDTPTTSKEHISTMDTEHSNDSFLV